MHLLEPIGGWLNGHQEFKTGAQRLKEIDARRRERTAKQIADAVARRFLQQRPHDDEYCEIDPRNQVSKAEQRFTMASQKGNVSLLLFPAAEGGYLHQNSAGNVTGQILKKAELPKFRVHDLRHTFATLALRAGTPVQMVSQQLGHSSIAITMDVSGHLVPQDNHDFVSSIGNTLLKSSTHPTRIQENIKAVTQ